MSKCKLKQEDILVRSVLQVLSSVTGAVPSDEDGKGSTAGSWAQSAGSC